MKRRRFQQTVGTVLLFFWILSACATPISSQIPFLASPTPSPTQPPPQPSLPKMPLFEHLGRYFYPEPVPVRMGGDVEGIHHGSEFYEFFRQGEVYAAYGLVKEGDRTYVLLAGKTSWPTGQFDYVADLVPLDSLPESTRRAVLNLPLLTGWDAEKQSLVQLSLEQAFARAQHAVGWTIYNEKYKPGPLELKLTAPDGSTEKIEIDVVKAANGDPEERKKIWHIMHDYNVVYDVGSGRVVPNRWQPEPTEEDLNRFIASLHILLYHTRFSPAGVWTGGQIVGNEWRTDGYGFHIEENGVYYNQSGIPTWFFAGPVSIQGPVMDPDGTLHGNNDFLFGKRRHEKFAVYNPFDKRVNPTIVSLVFWQDPNAKRGENPYRNASAIVATTDPDTNTVVYWEITHIDAESSPLLKQARDSNTLPSSGLMIVETDIPLEPGQYIGKVTTPLSKGGTDPYSTDEHVQFGSVSEPKPFVKYTNTNTFLFPILAYAATHHAGIETIDNDPWVIPAGYRKDTGFWIGKMHVAGHTPSPLGERALRRIWQEMQREGYFGATANPDHGGLFSQLSAYERFAKGKNPLAVLRKRRGPPAPKNYRFRA